MKDFLVFVTEERTGTCVADVDVGALGTVDAADLGVVVVEIEDGVAFGADEVPCHVIAEGRTASTFARHSGFGLSKDGVWTLGKTVSKIATYTLRIQKGFWKAFKGFFV